MYRRRKAAGRRWTRCVRVGRPRAQRRRAEAGGDLETRRKRAGPDFLNGPACRNGILSREIRCRLRREAVAVELAAGSVLAIRRLPAAAARHSRVAATDGAATRTDRRTGQLQRSLVGTATRVRPRTTGTGSSLGPTGRVRVTARSPRRVMRAARDMRISGQATKAARAIHGLSGCRSPRRLCASGWRRRALRGTAAVVIAVDRVVAGAVRRAPNRLRDRVAAVGVAIRAAVAMEAMRAVEAADTAAATGNAA
jgi:hypothetical protein